MYGKENTLKEQWQKRDYEYQEDGNNAACYPVEHRNKIVAASLATDELTVASILAD
jgi:hypothetical protein